MVGVRFFGAMGGEIASGNVSPSYWGDRLGGLKPFRQHYPKGFLRWLGKFRGAKPFSRDLLKGF